MTFCCPLSPPGIAAPVLCVWAPVPLELTLALALALALSLETDRLTLTLTLALPALPVPAVEDTLTNSVGIVVLNAPVIDTAGGSWLVVDGDAAGGVRVPTMLVRPCWEEEPRRESVDAAMAKGWVCAQVDWDCDCDWDWAVLRPRRENSVDVLRVARRILWNREGVVVVLVG